MIITNLELFNTHVNRLRMHRRGVDQETTQFGTWLPMFPRPPRPTHPPPLTKVTNPRGASTHPPPVDLGKKCERETIPNEQRKVEISKECGHLCSRARLRAD